MEPEQWIFIPTLAWRNVMIPRLVRMRQPDEFREVGNPAQLVAQIVENGGNVAFSTENIKDILR